MKRACVVISGNAPLSIYAYDGKSLLKPVNNHMSPEVRVSQRASSSRSYKENSRRGLLVKSHVSRAT